MLRTVLLCLFFALTLTGCSGSMPIPDQLQAIDETLRERGVTPITTSEWWQVKLPPQVIGKKLEETFVQKYVESHRKDEYIHYVTIKVHKNRMISMRATFRTDKTDHDQPEWNIGRLRDARPETMAEKFHRVHPMEEAATETWLNDVLLKNIRDPKFAEWMEDLK
jgi:hypothetical protein